LAEFRQRRWRGDLPVIAYIAGRVTLETLAGVAPGHSMVFRLKRAGGTIDDVVAPERSAEFLAHSARISSRT
jgi:hypothetical protein